MGHTVNGKEGSHHIAVALLLLTMGLLYILFSWAPTGAHLLFFQLQQQQEKNNTRPTISPGNESGYKDELGRALAEASRADKAVIIAMANAAYVEGDKPMLDLFLDGFWLGEDTRPLVDNLLIVAVDQTAFERCLFLRLHCYKLQTELNLAGEHVYMSKGFIEMMWRRTLFLGDVLRRGYHFIFTDTDVLWLRNPFERLSQNETIDLQISTDRFNGNQWSEANPVNTGFYMVRSNNKTVSLFNTWYERRNVSVGLKEQDVLSQMKKEGMFRELGLKVRFLDTVLFSGFCQDSRDVKGVSTVHANCCRTIGAKVADLTQVLHDWKRFKNSTSHNDTNAPFSWSRHSACGRSWL